MEGIENISFEDIPSDEIHGFWDLHFRYLVEDGIVTDEEEMDYFSGREYRGTIERHMLREKHRHHIGYFVRAEKRIGAVSYCTYHDEDGKCFILDFWVFPKYRGNGTGHECFRVLEQYTAEDGARYYELNSTKDDSVRFWKSLGFVENGKDEYEMPLYIKRKNG